MPHLASGGRCVQDISQRSKPHIVLQRADTEPAKSRRETRQNTAVTAADHSTNSTYNDSMSSLYKTGQHIDSLGCAAIFFITIVQCSGESKQ